MVLVLLLEVYCKLYSYKIQEAYFVNINSFHRQMEENKNKILLRRINTRVYILTNYVGLCIREVNEGFFNRKDIVEQFY